MLHDGEGGEVSVLDDGEQGTRRSVFLDQACLRCRAVVYPGHIFHDGDRAVGGTDGEVVQLRNRTRACIAADDVFAIADLLRAGGQDDVLVVEGGRNVRACEVPGGKLGRLHVHHHRALHTAIRKRNRRALHICQFWANEVLAEVVQSFLRQPLACEAELHDGHTGCVVLEDLRRQDAGRHLLENGLRERGDLCDGQIDLHAGLKVDFDDAYAGVGLRLDMLDVVYGGRKRTLADADNALGHVVRVQTVISPDDTDDRDVDLRQDVSRRRHNGGDAGDQNEKRDNDKGVGSSQRDFNQPHTCSFTMCRSLNS